MKAEVMDIHKPLCSVYKLVQAGNTVIFSPDKSYIKTKVGTHLTLHEKGGVYLLPAWITPKERDLAAIGEEKKEAEAMSSEGSGFHGQGR